MRLNSAGGLSGILVALALAARAGAEGGLPGPLLGGLGTWEAPVTTSDRRAQRYFNQGMALLYAFNHTEAIRAFRSAAHLDPSCAMAYWGVAYAFGPHVNKPMSDEDQNEAWKAAEMANSALDDESGWERALVAAIRTRYSPDVMPDRGALDQQFAAAMKKVVDAYPDDLDARTLYAEALMNTMPWDYWTQGGTPKPATEEVMNALRFVLERYPQHPGANHFLIHAVEASPNPEAGLPSADRLVHVAPGAGHLVHMSAHIYMRVGQYSHAVEANERAIRADREYVRRCRAQGFYVGAYVPHNLHFLWWAQLFDGRSAAAMKSALKVAEFAADNRCGPSRAVEAPRFRHLPWVTALRFGRWEDVLAVEQPPGTNEFLVDRGIWHFCRGLAWSGLGKSTEAGNELSGLREVLRHPDLKSLDSPSFPASSVLAVTEAWLSGRVAGGTGDRAGMIRELERAVGLEDAMPYMEPSFWPIPVRPALGAALLSAGQPERAESVFRDDVRRWPRNAWGLLGLETSLRQQGRQEAAAIVQRQFDAAWARADVLLRVDWF